MATELVHGLKIADVAIYQAVKVDLSKMGQPLTMLDTPLVANRPAYIRVFVTPDAGWQPRPVVARLMWAGGTVTKEVTASIAKTSTDADLTTTLNFSLTADQMPATIDWAVSLFEAPGATGAGSATGAKLPVDGTPAKVSGVVPAPVVKITFVPIRYGGDGSGRLPDTSAAQIKFLTDAMFLTYPISKVEATVRAPMDANYQIAAMGTNWDRIVNDICTLRQMDRPARNVFYYGLLAPATSAQAYCGRGCVEGVAALAQYPNDDFPRCSMGLGFTGQGTGVFLQEVAHSMGRPHAPCGNPGGVDRMFPYQTGKIGTWGFDLTRERLVNPTTTSDFMSYCQPVWISDYTFRRLLTWIVSVNGLAPSIASSPALPELATVQSDVPKSSPLAAIDVAAPRFAAADWRVVTVEADGTLIWGKVVRFDQLTARNLQPVIVHDQQGRASTVNGVLIPHTTGGAMLLLPASTPLRPRALQLGTSGSPLRSLRFD